MRHRLITAFFVALGGLAGCSSDRTADTSNTMPIAAITPLSMDLPTSSSTLRFLADETGGLWALGDQQPDSVSGRSVPLVWHSDDGRAWDSMMLPGVVGTEQVFAVWIADVVVAKGVVTFLAAGQVGDTVGPMVEGSMGIALSTADRGTTWSVVADEEIGAFSIGVPLPDGRIAIGGHRGDFPLHEQPFVWTLDVATNMLSGEPVAPLIGTSDLARVSSLTLVDGTLVASGVYGSRPGVNYAPAEWTKRAGAWVETTDEGPAACSAGAVSIGDVTVSMYCGGDVLAFQRGGEVPAEVEWDTDLSVDVLDVPMRVGESLVAVVAGEMRGEPAFCFADPSTCSQYSKVLAGSDDGEHWYVVDLGAPGFVVAALQRGDELIVFGATGGWGPPDVVLVIDMSTGRLPRLSAVPAPELELPIFDGQLELGERRFAAVATGCGPTQQSINGRQFEAVSWDVNEPFPDWVPHRDLDVIDASRLRSMRCCTWWERTKCCSRPSTVVASPRSVRSWRVRSEASAAGRDGPRQGAVSIRPVPFGPVRVRLPASIVNSIVPSNVAATADSSCATSGGQPIFVEPSGPASMVPSPITAAPLIWLQPVTTCTLPSANTTVAPSIVLDVESPSMIPLIDHVVPSSGRSGSATSRSCRVRVTASLVPDVPVIVMLSPSNDTVGDEVSNEPTHAS